MSSSNPGRRSLLLLTGGALVALLAFGLLARNFAERHYDRSETMRSMAPAVPAPPFEPTTSARASQSLGQKRAPDGPMIARNVSLAIVTKDFTGARHLTEGILARYHGYAAELTIATEPDTIRTLEGSLRIPAGELPAALNELKALGTVASESQKAEELSSQHDDLTARLKNSRETEQRLQAILEQRTGKMSDVLEVEQEIARVRGEIENAEAEELGIEHRVDYARVDLRLSEEFHAPWAVPSIAVRLRNAVVNGLEKAMNSLVEILLLAMNYGPVVLVWLALLFFPARYALRQRRNRGPIAGPIA